MGLELLKNFDFIDVIARGETDASHVSLFKTLTTNSDNPYAAIASISRVTLSMRVAKKPKPSESPPNILRM